MPRKASVLTQLQQNQTLFKPLAIEIKRITPQVLARYNLVSDGTIYKYIKGEACARGVEDLILKSMELFVEDQKTEQTANENRAQKLLTA